MTARPRNQFGKWALGLLLVAVVAAPVARAGSECRLWRGWAPSETTLVEELNKGLLPFVSGLKSHGLENFLVSLPLRPDTLGEVRAAGWALPDALALYDFETEKHLLDFLNTKAGEELLDLQEVTFPDTRSHWLDIAPFTGQLMVDRAYRTLKDPIDWMGKGEVRISVHTAKLGVARKVYLGQLNIYALAVNQMAGVLGLKGHLILVGDRYWVEFALFEPGASAAALAHPFHRVKDPIQERRWVLPGNRQAGAVDYGSAVLVPVLQKR